MLLMAGLQTAWSSGVSFKSTHLLVAVLDLGHLRGRVTDPNSVLNKPLSLDLMPRCCIAIYPNFLYFAARRGWDVEDLDSA